MEPRLHLLILALHDSPLEEQTGNRLWDLEVIQGPRFPLLANFLDHHHAEFIGLSLGLQGIIDRQWLEAFCLVECVVFGLVSRKDADERSYLQILPIPVAQRFR